jgi:hypothetical protein
MSDAFWTEMQGTAAELLEEFKTGVARLVRTARTVPDADQPYVKTDGAPAYTVLSGVALPVDKKMIDNKVVFARHTMLICAHPGFDILGTDVIELDGRNRTILKIRRVPDAGIAVVWKLALAD